MIKGVDLSANQTEIDWNKAHKSIEYAILRATTKTINLIHNFTYMRLIVNYMVFHMIFINICTQLIRKKPIQK